MTMTVYCACKYAPAELVAGFGDAMERLDPSPAAFTCSEGCTHPNMCSFAKAVIEEVHEREIRRLILTDCCDAMRRTYDALKMSEEMEFLWLLPLPHKTGKAEIRLFSGELKKLVRYYEDCFGQKFDAGKATEAYRRQKALEEDLPEENCIRVTGAHGGGRLISLAKSVFPDIPVIDDTCSGNRKLGQPHLKEGNAEYFFEWYAEALLKQKHPCMRMWEREDDFGRPGRGKPAGTIFHTIKFCDYYGYEYMSAQRNAQEPVLKIETDTTGSASGQMKTRLEAFREELEMGGMLSRGNEKPGKGKSAGAGVSGIRETAESEGDFFYEARKPVDSRDDRRGNKLDRKIKSGGESGKERLYVAGIDSGSASTDAVIMDSSRKILGRAVVPTAAGAENSSEKALNQALDQARLTREELASIVTTGYGRANITASDQTVTEITCHAKGAHFLDPEARTVIDIGGQDSKVIRIDEDGKVKNFVMNDKCAAGTGRFLEMQARTMGLSMKEMSEAGLDWKKDLTITSMCTVFAESEVVSLIAANTPPADIIHGLNKAIARRTAVLASRLGGEAPYIMTGGVAGNEGVVKCLEEELGSRIFVSEDAQICGAIGACLTALE